MFTLGFALFAMFFGAGNLILPPFIGLEAGSFWVYAIIGFGITGILGPFLGLLSIIKTGESFTDLGNKVHPYFSIILGSAIMLCIGPLIAVPRTGSLTYEMALLKFFPTMKPFIGSSIFFTITLLLCLSKSKVVDIIGNVLTPVLLVILGYLIITGILNPPNTQLHSNADANAIFTFSFIEGYQTLDVLASVIFAGIIIAAIKSKGFETPKERTTTALYAGIIAIVSLFFVYGGLIYLGATSGYESEEISRPVLLNHIAHTLLGSSSSFLLSICIALACLTTAIALTGAVAGFFEQITKGKIPYKVGVFGCTILAFVLSIQSVDEIIAFAVPILLFVYPIIFILILIEVFVGKFIRTKAPYFAAILVTTLITTLGLLENVGLSNEFFIRLRNALPLRKYELEWLIPSAVTLIIFMMLERLKSKKIKH
ncbi:branched-chain amino acid transport system II carrier protein [Vaginella massiliensis]|uniref:branched-chain amino acid transport system II carrier protein n=1 Tax=Vaginella massiliensis TaxID=1816680 RepID=UPI001F41A8C7|nr:branched-chain amino acid transport system II carrier protein [Vaginella massiliensis]